MGVLLDTTRSRILLNFISSNTFRLATGVRMCNSTYLAIMALDHQELGVPCPVLADALCTLLASVARRHVRENTIASVAHPLGRNQRRLIIQAHRPERTPD